jgi:hypothetical protein
MTSSSEPGKETARVTDTSPEQSHETVRIQLPTRPRSNPTGPAEPPSPLRAAAATIPAPIKMDSLKKETARITTLPDPPAKGASEMKKEQPSIDLPLPPPATRNNEMPMPLCWSLLAASATILILQIWNYLS